jgi:hypothetical protein
VQPATATRRGADSADHRAAAAATRRPRRTTVTAAPTAGAVSRPARRPLTAVASTAPSPNDAAVRPAWTASESQAVATRRGKLTTSSAPTNSRVGTTTSTQARTTLRAQGLSSWTRGSASRHGSRLDQLDTEFRAVVDAELQRAGEPVLDRRPARQVDARSA